MLREPSGIRPRPPAAIGPYRIVRLIAEGGMGAVYEAVQENPRRVVALKVLRPGLASKEYLRRFAHEAQILGRLQHPGIAQIHEAGSAVTDVGEQPYFAMELVDGQPLTQFATARELDVRQRVELMVKICEAVHHAHQKGVIHRDLKPANILVEPSGQPKVLDFGVARLTDADVQHVTRQTNVGQIVGTLPYMSPEQVAADTLELDVRSDVYALGVVLYELLAGRLPYDLSRLPLLEAARVIREVEPTTLGTKSRLLRGDLATITAKALEKEKDRRYASAKELADDLGRFLRDEPIVARPPSTLYQLGKFARRNRVLVGAVAAVFLALIAGVVASVRFALDAQAAGALAAQRFTEEQAAKKLAVERKEEAEAALRDAAASSQFLWDLLELADPNVSGVKEMSVRALLREAVRILDDPEGELPPGVERVVRQSLSRGFLALSEPELAERQAQRALDLALAAEPRDEAVIRSCKSHLGNALAQRGKYAEAARVLDEALESALAAEGSESVFTARVQNALSGALYNLNRPDEAERLSSEALETLRALAGPKAVELAPVLSHLTLLAYTRRDVPTAEGYALEAKEILEEHGYADRPHHFRVLLQLGRVRALQRKSKEAVEHFTRALGIARAYYGEQHSDVADALEGLAVSSMHLGELATAREYATQCLLLRRGIHGEHRDTATILTTLAQLEDDLGRPEEALSLLDEAYEMRMKIFGAESPAIGDSLRRKGVALMRVGRDAEAEETLLAARAQWERSLGAEHADLADVDEDLGDLMRKLDRGREAVEYSRACYERRARTRGETAYQTLDARTNLVRSLFVARDWEGARQFCENQVGLYAERLRPGHPLVSYTKIELGRAYAGLGRADEGVDLAREGWAVVREVPGLLLENRLDALTWLVDIHVAAGREGEAAEFRSELEALRR
jgi:tetratricopeptide (TPR) repeat protein